MWPECCPKCFARDDLRSLVQEESQRRGTCHYCRRRRVSLVSVSLLYDAFKNLMELYIASEGATAMP
jgi:hypothetical protein